MHYVIAHYHELALKGRNRPFLVDRLVRNLRHALQGRSVLQVESLAGRIRLSVEDLSQWPAIKCRLSETFGLANFAPAVCVSSEIASMSATVCDSVEGLSFHTFRITAKRADKSYPLTSIEVNRIVGAAVVERTGAHVNLGHPELNIFIEILGPKAYYHFERFAGAGGLPVGMSGKVACLLSGGIDSPVAAYRMISEVAGWSSFTSTAIRSLAGPLPTRPRNWPGTSRGTNTTRVCILCRSENCSVRLFCRHRRRCGSYCTGGSWS